MIELFEATHNYSLKIENYKSKRIILSWHPARCAKSWVDSNN